MTRALDYQPLFAPLAPERVRAYRDGARASGAGRNTAITGLVKLVGVIPVAIVAVVILGATSYSFASRIASGELLTPVLAVGFLVVVAVLVVRQILAARTQWERWARLDAFARTNGLTFSPRDSGPAYPGMIFGLGTNRTTSERLTRHVDPFVDLGSYRYTTGSGKSRSTHEWGFLALKLERRLPNMVLDSRANNLLGSNLPATFDRHQILKLEGDFNDHFTLYCPIAYERDALYVFTPDLMALLIDEAAPFDVELVDDWMFVYSAQRFELTDAATIRRLFRIVDTVGAKTLSQTDRYADERIGDRSVNLVAPAGARLKRGIPIVAIAIGALFAAIWAWDFFGDVLG